MAKENTLEFSGEVIELLKNAMFRVKLSNGHTIICHSAGKIRKNRIRILQGDTVKVSVSPYDLLILMVPREGFAPPTQAFSGLCSTPELPRHNENWTIIVL